MLILSFVCAWVPIAVFGGGRSQNNQTVDGEVTIHYHKHSDGKDTAQQLIDMFNAKKTGVRVEMHITPNDSYDDKLKVLTASGSRELDFFWVRTGSQVQQYISNNVLLEMGPLAADSTLDLKPIEAAIKGAARDNKWYGMPGSSSCWLLFYNKDLFDARGIPYPVNNLTWDQYLDLAKRLTYTENGKKYWGGVNPFWNVNLGAAAAGELLTAQEPMSYTRRYAEVLHRMYVDDHSHLDIGEMSAGSFDVYSTFGAGNVYMMINGDWTISLLEAPFEFGIAPLPVFPGIVQGASVGHPPFTCIYKNSAHPREAYKYIEWVTASDEATMFTAQNRGLPAYPTQAALEAYKKLVTVPGVDYRFSARVSMEQGTEPYYAPVLDAFRQELELYLVQEQSIDHLFVNFFKLRREIVESRR
jgi:ABC-type glycerol-3-phosphate transport system substrate-binding protein